MVELFGNKTFPSGMIERVDVVAEHSALAQCLALPLDDTLPENLRELRRA